MTPDLLAPYRRSGLPSAAPLARAASAPARFTGYRAFAVAEGGTKLQWLELRTGDGVTIARLYSGLAEIAYDHVDYTGLVLLFSGRLARLTGHHLRPVVEALLAGTCQYLVELLPGERFEEGAPVIERIELGSQAKPSDNPE